MKSMKIGIVSKPAHCKPHISYLKSLGHDVVGLGAKPTCIPKSIELIILRTASCSHGGDATSRAWSRKTGSPLVVENGLSGIRRELEKLRGEPVEKPLTDIDTGERMPQDYSPTDLGAFTYAPPLFEDLERLKSYAWAKAVGRRKYQRLADSYAEAVSLVCPPSEQKKIAKFRLEWKAALSEGSTLPTLNVFPASTFEGKPSLFVFAYLLSIPGWAEYSTHYSRKDLKEEYLRLTGKMLGDDMVPSISWWCGKGDFESEFEQGSGNEREDTEEVELVGAKEAEEEGESPSSRLDDIEDMLLEAMAAIADLRTKVGTGDLYATLKDLQQIGAKVTIQLGSSDET